MSHHPLHRVSCKVALYSPDGTQVLVMKYCFDGPTGKQYSYGLPGGHLEEGDTPEATVHRELLEEVGVDLAANLVPRSFWLHEDNKVLLAFTGTPTTYDLPAPPHAPHEVAEWVTIATLTTENIGSYLPFILENRPADRPENSH